jgi:hypothetical protein
MGQRAAALQPAGGEFSGIARRPRKRHPSSGELNRWAGKQQLSTSPLLKPKRLIKRKFIDDVGLTAMGETRTMRAVGYIAQSVRAQHS